MTPCLASSRTAQGWELVDTERLPRHAFDRMIAFGCATSDARGLAELVSLRNALTPGGSLLIVLGPDAAPNELEELAARAGFTCVRELVPDFSTLELKR